MSFLHILYTKINPGRRAKGKDSYVNDKSELPVFEDFDNEDGFVVYTEKDSIVDNRHAFNIQERLDYNNLQTNSVPGNQPSGLSLSCPSSTVDGNSEGEKEQSAPTFLTASDVPLKLSKAVEMIHNANNGLSNYKPHPIDIGEFFYDFCLEKTVLNSDEGNTRDKR